MVTTGFPRGRSAVVAALAVLALAGSSCSSGSDDGAPADTTAADTDSAGTIAAPSDTAGAPETVAPADTTNSGGSGGGDSDVACGGITAAAVGAAVGAGEFDSADDLSIDADTTCIYTNSAGFYGVSIATEPIDSYLVGELDGLSPDEALARLELVLTAPMDEGATIARVPLGTGEALVVTGTDSILGAPKGAGAAIVDGRVIVIDANGPELAADAAGFAPIVTNLLALAAAG